MMYCQLLFRTADLTGKEQARTMLLLLSGAFLFHRTQFSMKQKNSPCLPKRQKLKTSAVPLFLLPIRQSPCPISRICDVTGGTVTGTCRSGLHRSMSYPSARLLKGDFPENPATASHLTAALCRPHSRYSSLSTHLLVKLLHIITPKKAFVNQIFHFFGNQALDMLLFTGRNISSTSFDK